MAEIAHIWRSPKRRELMEELDTAQVFENEGVEGCAHRRGGKRNVLFVAAEDLDSVGVPPGRVKENFTVRGGDVMNWRSASASRSAMPSSRSRWSATRAS